ncbi:TVP38/TMEM64 family protein, partial [bacterium]
MTFKKSLALALGAFKWFVFFALVGVIASAVYMRLTGRLGPSDFTGLIQEHRANIGWVMAGLYLVSPSLILPTFYLTILAGTIWGPFWGVLVDLTGVTAGSTVALLLSRHVAADFIKALPGFRQAFRKIEKSPLVGWRLNVYMRLNPIFPSSLIAYFFGMTGISASHFAISTFLALLPLTAAAVSAGSSIAAFLTAPGYGGILLAFGIFSLSTALWWALMKYFSR